ncbi:MAG: Kef-type transport system rane subunit [Nitrospirae bacterium]|nr:Kef-type transport system rane subunit [Nitrospirota bacterium]
MQDAEVTILRELIILLAVSLPITFLFHKAKLPALVGFLITGVLIGPHGTAVITETQAVERLADVGVVLLLFTVGLEFSIEDIMRSGRQLLLGGGTQVVLTVGAVAGIALLFGYPMTQALFFGFLASLSSTAIVLKMYSDRAELDTAHGRLSTGILLFQDMAVVPMMLLLPVLGQAGTAGEITPVSVMMSLGKAVLGLAVVFLAARQIVPFLLHHVIRLRNREMFFLLVVLLCLGTAWITFSLGLSLALGAFLAGLIIAESEYSHQIVADILPFRDYFASIFFISVGMLLKTDYFLMHWPLLIGLTTVLALLKTGLVTVTAAVLRYPVRSALLSGLALAQVGEFSFLLADQGSRFGLIAGNTFQAFINTSILTMIATPFIMHVAPWFADRIRLPRPDSTDNANVCSLTGHTIIAGYGLNGRNLARTLRATRIPYTVLEVNADTIRKARDDGEPIIYGDITREDVLVRAGADCARVIVFAISDFSATRMAIRFVRSINPSIFILVRTRYAAEVDELLKLGADQVIAEEFETSIEIFSRVLHQYHVPGNIIANQISLVRFDGYKMLRGLSLDQEKIGRLAALFAAATVDNVQVQPECACIGKTLRELDIRRSSGATVLAIVRNGEAVTNPGIDFRLEADDILVLLGAHKELDAAATLLTQRPGGSAAGTA